MRSISSRFRATVQPVDRGLDLGSQLFAHVPDQQASVDVTTAVSVRFNITKDASGSDDPGR